MTPSPFHLTALDRVATYNTFCGSIETEFMENFGLPGIFTIAQKTEIKTKDI